MISSRPRQGLFRGATFGSAVSYLTGTIFVAVSEARSPRWSAVVGAMLVVLFVTVRAARGARWAMAGLLLLPGLAFVSLVVQGAPYRPLALTAHAIAAGLALVVLTVMKRMPRMADAPQEDVVDTAPTVTSA